MLTAHWLVSMPYRCRQFLRLVVYDLLATNQQRLSAIAIETVNRCHCDISVTCLRQCVQNWRPWSSGRSLVLNGLTMPVRLGVCVSLMTTEFEKSGLCFLVSELLHRHIYSGATYGSHHFGLLASTAGTNRHGNPQTVCWAVHLHYATPSTSILQRSISRASLFAFMASMGVCTLHTAIFIQYVGC